MVCYWRPVDYPVLWFKYLFRGIWRCPVRTRGIRKEKLPEIFVKICLEPFYIPSPMFIFRITIEGTPEVLLRRYVFRNVSFPFHVGVFSVSCRSCLLSWTSSCLRPSLMSTSTRIHFYLPPWGGALDHFTARQRQQALPES